MNPARLMGVGVVIILVGFMVAAVGAFLGPGGSTSSGGFILVGPIPIVFGSGPNSGTLAPVAIAISAVIIVVYLVSFFVRGSGRRREVEAGTESE
jgi:uncharacterized membrane protein